jgi:hypothetical protein
MVISTITMATVPGYEDTYTPHKIADYTIEFLGYYGASSSGTFTVFSAPDLLDDEVIEQTLKGCWIMNETHIHRITHVNGIPIEQTKWAKYGGVIQHVGETLM